MPASPAPPRGGPTSRDAVGRRHRRRQLTILTLAIATVHLAVAGAWIAAPEAANRADPASPMAVSERSPGLVVSPMTLAGAVPDEAPLRGMTPRPATAAATPDPVRLPMRDTPDNAQPALAAAKPLATGPRDPSTVAGPETQTMPVRSASTPATGAPTDVSRPAATPSSDPVSGGSSTPSDTATPSGTEDGGRAAEVVMAEAAPATGRALPARTTGPSQAPAVPIYATRLPAAQTLRYALRRGAFSGTGELRFGHDGRQYQARLEGRIAGVQILAWTSDGAIDGAGLAPVRYTDRRRGGSEQAANFVREQGVVRYSGPSVQFALPRGAQDRLSWMLQIAAIAGADPAAVAEGQKVLLWVSGARGDADVWVFRSLGVQPMAPDDPRATGIKLVREPREPYDTRVEVWLDPAREFLPALARLGSARGDDVLELALRP
jgi:hypothetical protein